MELKDLTGEHVLDAVDLTTEKFTDRDDNYKDCEVCRFRLDGVTYVAAEDPEDGYRSHMRDLLIDDKGVMKNPFNPIKVICKYRSESGDSWKQEDDVLELIDVETNKIVLEVGTGNTDNSFPYFIADFQPRNMAINGMLWVW